MRTPPSREPRARAAHGVPAGRLCWAERRTRRMVSLEPPWTPTHPPTHAPHHPHTRLRAGPARSWSTAGLPGLSRRRPACCACYGTTTTWWRWTSPPACRSCRAWGSDSCLRVCFSLVCVPSARVSHAARSAGLPLGHAPAIPNYSKRVSPPRRPTPYSKSGTAAPALQVLPGGPFHQRCALTLLARLHEAHPRQFAALPTPVHRLGRGTSGERERESGRYVGLGWDPGHRLWL